MGFVLHSVYIPHPSFLPRLFFNTQGLRYLSSRIYKKKFFVNLPSHPHTPLNPLLFIGVSSVRVSVRVDLHKKNIFYIIVVFLPYILFIQMSKNCSLMEYLLWSFVTMP